MVFKLNFESRDYEFLDFELDFEEQEKQNKICFLKKMNVDINNREQKVI